MRKVFLTIWAAICTVWVSTASTCLAFASEALTEQSDTAAKVLLTMDVFQKVCLIIVIIVAALVLLFYIAKMILKKLHVPLEQKENDDARK